MLDLAEKKQLMLDLKKNKTTYFESGRQNKVIVGFAEQNCWFGILQKQQMLMLGLADKNHLCWKYLLAFGPKIFRITQTCLAGRVREFD